MKANDLLMLALVAGAAYFLYTHWSQLTGPNAPSTTTATTFIGPLQPGQSLQPVDASGNPVGPAG